jgi:hypothetical protein
VAGTDPTTPPGTASTYRIQSSFYRETKGVLQRLKPGDKLTQGDALSLQVQASIPLYFYIVNEDEFGDSFLLFPLPSQGLQNPLQPGQRQRLPSTPDGELISWQVTSTGQREHFLLVASPEPSTEFDEVFTQLPKPVFGRVLQNARLSSDAILRLRSVGGLTSSPVQTDQQLRLMPAFSTPLTDNEETVQGVWIRHASFMNPDK